jgi:tetratricopeptide (TPR) repeat protein
VTESKIDALRRRVEQDPASIAFAQLAEEYRRAGQLSSVVETCRAGLAVHPEYASARVTLGRALLALGQLDEASAELNHVLAAAPANLTARRALAETRRAQGRLPEALDQFRLALTLAPNDPDLERQIHELTQHVTVESSRAAASHRTRSMAVVAALERWLEAIRAARAHRVA